MATDTQPKPKRQRLTDEQRKARLLQQIARIEHRARQKTKKARDYELIVLGGTVLAEMRENAAFREQFAEILLRRVKDQKPREAVADWLSPIYMPA